MPRVLTSSFRSLCFSDGRTTNASPLSWSQVDLFYLRILRVFISTRIVEEVWLRKLVWVPRFFCAWFACICRVIGHAPQPGQPYLLSYRLSEKSQTPSQHISKGLLKKVSFHATAVLPTLCRVIHWTRRSRSQHYLRRCVKTKNIGREAGQAVSIIKIRVDTHIDETRTDQYWSIYKHVVHVHIATSFRDL